jgi:hypothetical protein
MPISLLQRILFILWLTALSFLLLGNVHAWEIPAYLRLNSSARLWFSLIEGDLIQNDRTKLGIVDNLSLKQDSPAWEYQASFRVGNIHQLRFRAEPSTSYDHSATWSSIKAGSFRVGYDLDFYMTPNALVGGNADLDFNSVNTTVSSVRVANAVYNYTDDEIRLIPTIGLHAVVFPALQGIALRPNISTRVGWWDFQTRTALDWESAVSVDIPVNELWTWSISGGYRIRNTRFTRQHDTVDMTRRGFFVETSVLF